MIRVFLPPDRFPSLESPSRKERHLCFRNLEVVFESFPRLLSMVGLGIAGREPPVNVADGFADSQKAFHRFLIAVEKVKSLTPEPGNPAELERV